MRSIPDKVELSKEKVRSILALSFFYPLKSINSI